MKGSKQGQHLELRQIIMGGAIGILGLMTMRALFATEARAIAPTTAPLQTISPQTEELPPAESITPPLASPAPPPPLQPARSPLFPPPLTSPPGSRPIPLPRRRAAPPMPTVQPFLTLNSQQLDKQLQTYLRYLRDVGSPDILIVGSSRALQGIDPVTLQQALHRNTPLKVYNFGVNGATAQVVELLLTQLLTPAQLPRLILWADGARAFNSGRTDQTYNRLLVSPGYHQLRAGVRPALLAGTLGSELRRQLTRSLIPFPAPWETPTVLTAKARSGSPTPDAPDPLTQLQLSMGFKPFDTRFDPNSYYRRFPKVPGYYDGDYSRFTLNGRQTQALRNVLAFAQAHKIPVVVVNLPMTRLYLDRTRAAYELDFRAYMQAVERTKKLTFYDLGQRWPTRHDYFMDPSHLNREGAAAVATHLGTVLLQTNLLSQINPLSQTESLSPTESLP